MQRRLSEFFNMPCFDAQGNDLIGEIPQEAVQEALLVLEVESEISEQKNPDPNKKKKLVEADNEDLYAREDD